MKQFDVLIVGSGAAGLSLALQLPSSLSIGLLSKADVHSGSTSWAQGGMAAVLHERDTVASHVDDTLQAGAGLCHEDAVRFTVEQSAAVVDWLVAQGVDFDLRNDQPDDEFREFHLTMEGGHSIRRILHAADQTGSAISNALNQRIAECENVEILTDRCVVDLICGEDRVKGAYVLNTATGYVETIVAPTVALATGGASKAYLYTSNPDGATGDGIALAWRAGCRVANLEFNQFHPTCLYNPEARTFLLTEALRGEGATLHLPNGERFMPRFDHRAELAPRDIVARAIDHEMKRLGLDCVYLDVTHKTREEIEAHFPTVQARCQALGIDMAVERIPVVPAAHYTCGGVVVDQFGATDLPGLYVIGETACTGLHGANRMASNSLLECFVYATSAAKHIKDNHLPRKSRSLPQWDDSRVRVSDEAIVIKHSWQALRRLMWDYVGIVRTNRRLKRAATHLRILEQEVDDYYASFTITKELLELRNLTLVSSLMVACARERKESRGLHYNSDYPNTLESGQDSVLVPTNRRSQLTALPRYVKA
ncbi:L-aspartate oxidase [gamma proteobacterium HIMB55]|nr:L-aspartate oxidase [gamma proteobacterium HIMB55]